MKPKQIQVEAKAWRDGLSIMVGLSAELDEGDSIANCGKVLRKKAAKIAQDGLQDKFESRAEDNNGA